MAYDEEPPEELVREHEYQRRKRLNDRFDPRDPRYDDRFDLPYSFCIHPEKCAGRTSCPRKLSCSE